MKYSIFKLCTAVICTALFARAKDATVYEIDDVRVAPMLETQWDQRCDGWGNNCFNYYTPGNSYCGCVATAVAQVMRYHRWPQTAVSAETYTCKVQNGTTESNVNLTMKGGIYNWDAMPLKPYTTGYSDSAREAIGRLVYDVGVALRTTFGTQYGSAANGAAAMHALPNNFHYANAQAIWFNQSQNFSFTSERFQQLVVPSLDAGLPVVLSVNGTDGGHAIVADGYGFNNGKFYVHCNYGSSGYGDGWYAPPEFSGMGYPFTVCIGVVFNISPHKPGSIASGRVLDCFGQPVANANVTVELADGIFTRTTTNAKGIYHFFGPSGTYTVKASASGGTASRTVVLEKIISSTTNPDGSYIMPYAYVCGGNSAWNDLVLDETVSDPESSFSQEAGYALGTTGGKWRTSADFPWTMQNTNSVNGTAMQSGYLPYGAPAGVETWLGTEVKGPAVMSFKYTYNPYYNDTFAVLLDDTNTVLSVCDGSGSFTAWSDSGTIVIPEGCHSIRFSYKTLYQNYLTRFQGVCLDSLDYTYTGELYSTTPVPVPASWLKKAYPEYESFLDNVPMLDMVAWIDEDDDGLLNWQEFALNTNPTNADALMITGISVRDNKISLTLYPEIGNPDYPRIIEGSSALPASWEPVDFEKHRFFRVRVDIPEIDAP